MTDLREIAPNIYQLKVPLILNVQSINVYIFRGETPTIVDTGTNTPEVFETIQTALRKLGIKKLEQVIATHWHSDHVGAAHQFAKEGTRILIGSKDYPEWKTFAKGESFEIFREWARDEWEIPDGLVIEGMIKSYEKLRRLTAWPEGVEEIKPQQMLHAGNYDLKAIPTPGHTIGHLAFFEEQQKILFSGDMLLPDQVAFPGIWLEDGKVTSGLASQLQSIDLMKKLGAHQYLPAHGEPQLNPSERCQETRAQILTQVANYDPTLSVYEGALRLRQGKTKPGVLFMQLHYVFGWKQVFELSHPRPCIF
ncbi:MBL fold metallo-hydrolase [Desulfitobacterium sp.]|uniref:MBL fold metallo-hydrolase n=1 Tax=Desulfitobacterium sp. TaxID=49981 RepID=UPI002C064737|nr:MBL fold metallo-hydrolase [Desulfitobacterium sp.]HVJ49872.1 MBL fold metallo-hydrolase [Desulfitobacterium sp.]